MDTNLDMHNRVTGDELAHMLRLQLRTLKDHPEMAKMLPPLMVWGAPGLGKSSILQQAAREEGIGFIDVRLAQREPVDIRGLPVPKGDRVEWLVSADWPRDPNSRGIILFDEITAADRSLQVAAYEFILDRRLGELYRVPDGWYICAAGNRTVDRAVAATMSSALANRFMHVELAEDVESWVNWARRSDIDPTVIGFLRFRPTLLFKQEGENLERGWPSPRAWERVSRMLGIMGAESETIVRHMVYGLVGNHAGVEFMAFRKLSEEMADALEIMRDPRKEVVIPERADMKYALCAAAAYYVWRGTDEADAAARLDGFFRIAMALTSDFASMLMLDAMEGTQYLNKETACQKLFCHKDSKAWKAKHGAALRAHITL